MTIFSFLFLHFISIPFKLITNIQVCLFKFFLKDKELFFYTIEFKHFHFSLVRFSIMKKQNYVIHFLR